MDSDFVRFTSSNGVSISSNSQQLTPAVEFIQPNNAAIRGERFASNQSKNFENFYGDDYKIFITDSRNNRIDKSLDYKYLVSRCEDILRKLFVFESNRSRQAMCEYSITRLQSILTYIVLRINNHANSCLLSKSTVFIGCSNLLDCLLDTFNSDCVLWTGKSRVSGGNVVRLVVAKRVPFITVFLRLPGSQSFFSDILNDYDFRKSIDLEDYTLIGKVSLLSGYIAKLIDKCNPEWADALLTNINNSFGQLFSMLSSRPSAPPSSTKELEKIEEVSGRTFEEIFETILTSNLDEIELSIDIHGVTIVSQENCPANPAPTPSSPPLISLLTPEGDPSIQSVTNTDITKVTREKNFYVKFSGKRNFYVDDSFEVSVRDVDIYDGVHDAVSKDYFFKLEVSRDYSEKTGGNDRRQNCVKSCYFINKSQKKYFV